MNVLDAGTDQSAPWSVTRDNWAEPPGLRWSFLHLDEVLATAPIAASAAPVTLEVAPIPVLDVITPRYDVTARIVDHTSVEQLLAESHTDGFLVMHHGRIAAEGVLRPGLFGDVEFHADTGLSLIHISEPTRPY